MEIANPVVAPESGTDPRYPFGDRPPTEDEVERIRLTLSAYRDGSGQERKRGVSQPGWRDFERATADALGGGATESKAVFDLELPFQGNPDLYGLSLKTSRQDATGQVLMELSNSHSKFWARLNTLHIDPKVQPLDAGCALIALVMLWHEIERDRIDLDHSGYLVLTHDSKWHWFQLFWFGLDLAMPDPGRMRWEFAGKRISGYLEGARIWDWYGWGGGQLKYYPKIEWAKWRSDPFTLENPPAETVADRAARYWPDLWPTRPTP